MAAKKHTWQHVKDVVLGLRMTREMREQIETVANNNAEHSGEYIRRLIERDLKKRKELFQ
jgi:predicted DNA-binding protein